MSVVCIISTVHLLLYLFFIKLKNAIIAAITLHGDPARGFPF